MLYSDVNLRIYELNNSPLAFDLESIKQNVLAILSTNKGSRVFRPEFGCNLYKYLFQPIDNITASDIQDEIIEALTVWETRIELLRVDVKADYPGQQYYVDIQYRIPSLEKQDHIEFNVGGNQ